MTTTSADSTTLVRQQSRALVNNPDLPTTTHPSYDRMIADWKLCRDLKRGTRAIHEGGTTYLPKHAAELNGDYQMRSQRTEVYNGFGRTIAAIVGLVFQRDPELPDTAPAPIVEHWKNITGGGIDGPTFTRRIFADALTIGLGGILVDYPPVVAGLTLAAEQKAGARPYWVWYQAENVLSWRMGRKNGAVVLTQLVLRECVEAPNGLFGTAIIYRYRQLWRDVTPVINEIGVAEEVIDDTVRFQLWETRDEKNDPPEKVGPPGVISNQTEIPFSGCITGNDAGDLWEAEPPLKDLADVNLAHYQVRADRRHLMHIACVPVPFRKGVLGRTETVASLAIGANVLIDLPADGEFGWAEVTGSALQPTGDELAALERQMASLGMAFLQSETRAAETAEAKRIDTTAQNATIASSARALKMCIDKALGFHAQYLGEKIDECTVNQEFERVVMDAPTMTALSGMEAAGQLDLETFLTLLLRGHVLPEDTDVDEIVGRIALGGGRTSTPNADPTDDPAGDPSPADPEKLPPEPIVRGNVPGMLP